MSKITFKNTDGEACGKKDDQLMEISKNAGWPIAYGCEDGLCGTCIIKIDQGKDALNDMEESEKQTLDIMGLDDGQHRLACQCRIKKDDEDIVIEQ